MKSVKRGLVAVAVAVLVAGCGPGGKPIPIAPSRSVATQPSPSPSPAGHALTPADITLVVKIIKKECFGSAGCNITYTVVPSYVATVGAEPNSAWDVTYEIKGGAQQQINTLHMTFDGTGQHGSFDADREELISTGSDKAQLAATVTEVSRH